MIQSIIISLGLLLAVPNAEKVDLSVNVETSTIKWTGAKVGGSHYGLIQLKDGKLAMENGKLTGGSFTIDMTSMTNEDLSGEYQGKLVGHLKSDDFFAVDKYPTASFVITEAIPQGTGKYKITGDLTIKGITKSIKFPATVTENGNQYTASATITVDRSEYDVKYGSGSFFDDLGDKVIYDDFDLEVNLTVGK